jgi:hypothetical protein
MTVITESRIGARIGKHASAVPAIAKIFVGVFFV